MGTLRRHFGVALASAGLAILALGVAPAGSEPVGADPCPAGSELIAKFEYGGGGYVFEKPAGNEDVVVLSDASASGATWTSSMEIGAVVVKGGSGEGSVHVVTYDPPALSGTFDNSQLLNEGGQVPDISFVAFCGPGSTTTTEEETTTTEEETTTTEEDEVIPTQLTRDTAGPATTAAQVLGKQLPRTGFSEELALAGVLLVSVGLALELVAWRRRAMV